MLRTWREARDGDEAEAVVGEQRCVRLRRALATHDVRVRLVRTVSAPYRLVLVANRSAAVAPTHSGVERWHGRLQVETDPSVSVWASECVCVCVCVCVPHGRGHV